MKNQEKFLVFWIPYKIALVGGWALIWRVSGVLFPAFKKS